MKTLRALSIMLPLISSACASTAPVTEPALAPREAEAICRADEEFCKDTGERGLEGWMDWWAQDGVLLKEGGSLAEGHAAVRAHFAAQSTSLTGLSWKPDRAGLSESGDLGFTEGSYVLKIPAVDGKPDAVSEGRYMTIWARQDDGGYKVLTDLGGLREYRGRRLEVPHDADEWSSKSVFSSMTEEGDLAVTLGSWTARVGDQVRGGNHLTVWRLAEDDVWEIAAEIGNGS